MCELYLLISRTKVDSSVSQDSVLMIKENRFLTRFKLVFKSANLAVLLRAFTVRMDKLLFLRSLSSSHHSTSEHWGT